MSDYTFVISVSDERDRLQIVFADAEAAAAFANLHIQRVGGRRDQAGVTTHHVFPAEVEATVRAGVVTLIQRETERLAWAAGAAARDAQAAADRKMEAARKRAEAKERKTRGDAIRTGIEVKMVSWDGRPAISSPFYAPAASKVLRAAGAEWNTNAKLWIFPRSANTAAVQAILPKIRKALVDRKEGLDSGRIKPFERTGRVMGDGARWNVTDDEFARDHGRTPRGEADFERMYGTPDY